MEPERWKQLEALCQAALEQQANERAAFLAKACGTDEALRREVEALLAHATEAQRFMEEPAVQVMVKALAEDGIDPHSQSAMAWKGRSGATPASMGFRPGREPPKPGYTGPGS